MAIQTLEGFTDFAKAFVARVRGLDHVTDVWLADDDEGPRIWTYIDAEPTRSDLRESVYLAEMETLRQYPSPLVGFRLVNRARHRSSGAEPPLPPDGRLLWRRDS